MCIRDRGEDMDEAVRGKDAPFERLANIVSNIAKKPPSMTGRLRLTYHTPVISRGRVVLPINSKRALDDWAPRSNIDSLDLVRPVGENLNSSQRLPELNKATINGMKQSLKKFT
eukprot:TRINITY_DN8451_c0_g1_i3.p1 TRINITY_DN8451_c0_g1~~TRINITY_DN8451_c0_g1_i3.p1  ORF type:complete len:114 (-),score=16.42 TRINITY_DN8451_c0_g1_i3:103-444(-)